MRTFEQLEKICNLLTPIETLKGIASGKFAEGEVYAVATILATKLEYNSYKQAYNNAIQQNRV